MSIDVDASGSEANVVTRTPFPNHILIIGAGITGLTLAQSLKKAKVPFTIFERDPTPFHRGGGWGLTIHWALNTFTSLLPQHLVARLPEVFVDPDASTRGENGSFSFFDLRSGEARWRVPPAKRIRVSRERLRKLLMDGIDIQWSKTVSSLSYPTSRTVLAHFADGTTSAPGSLLVGADGTLSRVRSLLVSEDAANNALPVRLLGVSVIYPRSLALKARALDPFFFQGGDPETDVFHYFSFLDTPLNNTREGERKDAYECQILVSWPYRKGFMGREELPDVPLTDETRVKLMKQLAEGWTDPFKEIVMNIPETAQAKTIRLEDWVPKIGAWDNKEGRVTMIGDAAHAMTMFRGEGANHGITDVAVLVESILSIVAPREVCSSSSITATLDTAINEYEYEMIGRTAPAVLTSRKACLDAHDYRNITEQSPLVAKRAIVFDEQKP